jgi:hypothetical protein
MEPARLVRFAAALLLSTGAVVGVASAQQAGGAVVDAAGVDAGLQRQVNLSPAEQLAEADNHLVRMEQARSNARRQLMDAREQRDVVKTLCLNEKLTQLNVAIASAQERREALAAAAKRSDADLASHEYAILVVLRQRSDQLTTEANQCIGEEAGFVGQASVTATVDKDLPTEDPSDYPTFGVTTGIPQCSSCYD